MPDDEINIDYARDAAEWAEMSGLYTRNKMKQLRDRLRSEGKMAEIPPVKIGDGTVTEERTKMKPLSIKIIGPIKSGKTTLAIQLRDWLRSKGVGSSYEPLYAEHTPEVMAKMAGIPLAKVMGDVTITEVQTRMDGKGTAGIAACGEFTVTFTKYELEMLVNGLSSRNGPQDDNALQARLEAVLKSISA